MEICRPYFEKYNASTGNFTLLTYLTLLDTHKKIEMNGAVFVIKRSNSARFVVIAPFMVSCSMLLPTNATL